MTMFLLFGLLAALAIGGWLAWQYWGAGQGLFGGAHESRIGLSEVANVDGKRKLLLIFRDGVEHLVMTGGPIDVVIEQGILPQQQRRQVPTQEARTAAGHEPRLAVQSAPGAPPESDQEAQPGFGRLRQRPAPSAPAEPYTRPERTTLASGSGSR